MRLIDADWLVQRVEGWQDQLAETYGQNDEYVLCLAEVLMKIDDAPTADVTERKVGKWINEFPMDMGIYIKTGGFCSECGQQGIASQWNFCPNCGARMVEDD